MRLFHPVRVWPGLAWPAIAFANPIRCTDCTPLCLYLGMFEYLLSPALGGAHDLPYPAGGILLYHILTWIPITPDGGTLSIPVKGTHLAPPEGTPSMRVTTSYAEPDLFSLKPKLGTPGL